MADNINIQNHDVGGLVIGDPFYQDELVTFTGADTYVRGLIMARDSVLLKLIPFVVGGVTNEDGIPKAIIGVDLVATGAGDLQDRPLISGKVRLEKLVIKAGGTVTIDIQDQLRDFTIISRSVEEQSILDNQ